LITRQIPEAAVKYLREKKIRVDIYSEDKPILPKELIRRAKGVDAVIALLTDKFDKEVIDSLSNCKVIANFAVGYNNIDVEYAKKKNIIITNTPNVLNDSTADLAMTLVLACARRLIEGEKLIRAKKFRGWEPNLLLGVELKNKIFGVLGSGRIGTATAIRAKAFGTKILYTSRSKNFELEKATCAGKVSLNVLLKKSDIISVHLPLTSETYHILNREKLNLLKNTAILVNTGRGELIDEKELIKLLKKKKIMAAGLDVYENEPNINPELLKLNNVVLLPHLGSATEDARNNMAMLAAKNVVAVLYGKKPFTPVG
ncbi:MAG TPA: D-glycerate dehydrogenase, partial [Ignavibacteria bacterium]|nr:D-glycerate dehydrogenase [Ignavibacteria bacterium]